ncbi:hypothetical protein ES708_18053 [subsurface metagenome]
MIPARGPYSGQSYRLYNDYNDIHVFIEDAGFENLYKEIFRKYNLAIRKVFSKNGKKSVIEAAHKCNDQRCVYIIDRDWDDVLGITYKFRNLLVLEKHSIENYLIDYSAFYAIVLADNSRKEIDKFFNKQVFNDIIDEVSNRLRPLFECYLTMQLSGDSRPSCSRKPGSFQERNRSCAPDKRAIASFIKIIRIPTPQLVKDYFEGDVLRVRGHGKYMLHFVWAGIQELTALKQLKIDSLMIRLAQVADDSVFKVFYDKIMEISIKKRKKVKNKK